MNIGKAIKTIRKAKGIRQKELCKLAGITQSHLSLVELGKNKISEDCLKRIAESLNTSMIVFIYLALEESDVHPSRVEIYKLLKPSIDGLITQII